MGNYWLETEDGKKVANYVTNIITNKGTFVLNSGTLQSNGNSNICYAIDAAGGSRTEIHGGDILAYGSAIRCAHGYYDGSNVDFLMDGGNVFSKYGAAIWVQLPGSTGTATGSYTISGGVIEAEAYYAMYDYSYGQAFGKTADEKITYYISGGTFISGDGYGLLLGYTGGTKTDGGIYDPDVNVTGGRFIGTSAAMYSYSDDTSVTGGYFSTDTYMYDESMFGYKYLNTTSYTYVYGLVVKGVADESLVYASNNAAQKIILPIPTSSV